MFKRCTQCLISEHFPNISFDSEGVCSLCTRWNNRNEKVLIETKEQLRKKLDQTIEEARGLGEYDCVVSYSCGKDSTYTIYLLKERYNLKILALTIDNGFLADAAIKNGRSVCDYLGVDWIICRPNQKFMKSVYRNSLTNNPYSKNILARSSEICASCIQIVNATTLREAARRQIPLVAGGYIGAQIPADSPIIRGNSSFLDVLRSKTVERLNQIIHPQFSHYVDLTASEKKGLEAHLTIINPLLVEDYNEKAVIRIIETLGWKLPLNTGRSSTNCLLNDFAITEHQKKYRFHPYELEICQQVRSGFMTKKEAEDRLNCSLSQADYDSIRAQLQL